MGWDTRSRYNYFDPTLDFLPGQLWCRFPVQNQGPGVGIRVGSKCFLLHRPALPNKPNNGRICLNAQSQTSPLPNLDARPSSSREGCTSVPPGPCHIHVSTNSPDSQNVDQNQGGESDRPLDLSPLASIPLVGAGEEHGNSTTPSPPPSPVHNQDNQRGAHEGVPGPSSGSAHFRSNLAHTHAAHGLDQDDLDFLSHHIASGSASGYGYTWLKFSSFCSGLGVEPFTCSPIIIVKYIRHIFEKGAKYRTINHARCAISKLHCGFDGKPAGQHQIVSQAVRSAFRLRPPLPKYRTTFDIKPVFTFIKQILGNNDILTLKMLTFKCLYLLSFSSIARVSTLSILGANLEEHRDHIIVPLLSLEKQAKGPIYYYLCMFLPL